MKLTISVIIPTFNRSNDLLRAVNSVLQQTYPVSEIIICDDGSTDSSFEQIKKLNNTCIKWINCGRNGRPSIPRNYGIKEAKGNWIAFLDSDDVWLKDKIEKQVELIQNEKTLAICSNAYQISNEINNGEYLKFNGILLRFKDLVFTNFIICSSVLINRDLLISTAFFSESEKFKAIEDYNLWLKVSTRVEFSYIKTPLLNYYDNPQTSIRENSKSEIAIKRHIFSDLIKWKLYYKFTTPYFSLLIIIKAILTISVMSLIRKLYNKFNFN